MTPRPPGMLPVLRLLAWTALVRLLRAARIARSRRAKQPGARQPTARKRGDGLSVLLVLMLPLFVFQSLVVSSQAVHRLALATHAATADPQVMFVAGEVASDLAVTAADADDDYLRQRLQQLRLDDGTYPTRAQVLEHFRRHGPQSFREPPELPFLLVEPLLAGGGEEARSFRRCGSVLLLALLLMLLAAGMGGGSAGLAGSDWSFGWLMTFPVATRSLVLAKSLEYGLVQLFPWFTLCPLLWQLLAALGQAYALPLAVLATLLTALLTGALRFGAETWLRLHLSLRQLRSVQGLCSLLTLLLMAGVFTICLGQEVPAWFLALATRLPAWLDGLPGSWPMALAAGGLPSALPGILASLAGLPLVIAFASRQLAHGTMRSGGVDPGKRTATGSLRAGRQRLDVLGKDLSLLARDRNFLVQTVVVPMFVVGLQLLVNPGLGGARGKAVALVAYGIGVYSLIGGCFQVLSGEGRALWILYTLPVQVAAVLRRKVRLWAGLAMTFASCALLAFHLRAGGGTTNLRFGLDLLSVVLGVFAAAHLAAGISILGTDPAQDHVPRQPKARHIYLYFFFASTYMASLQSPDLTARAAGLLVFGTLAFAVWQRACDRLPWLLDPVDEDRRRIVLFDGAAAVTVFVVLQALVMAIVLASRRSAAPPSLLPVFVAFAVAGVVTVGLYVLLLSARGIELGTALHLRARGFGHAGTALVAGLGLGAASAGLARLYLWQVQRHAWFDLPAIDLGNGDFGILLLLSVVAAPLCEEVLFRGLVFQGLRRTLPPLRAALWSGALFAVVHPLASWPPVFVFGVLSALLYERTRFLPACMLAHAVYNAIVVGIGN